jgi:nuclear GTP-binding protein
MADHVADPYTMVIRNKSLPLALLGDPYKNAKMNLLTTESFGDTFGKKKVRKRPRLGAEFSAVDTLMESVNGRADAYTLDADSNVAKPLGMAQSKDSMFERGTSKRIWQELYKVIDASDVLIQVLDVRNPMGTRCKRIEDELKTRERRHKHLVFVLNKVDLVPTWVTARWVRVLSKEYPTLAFHASITNPFGKGSLIQLLKQFSAMHKDKKEISVGFIGSVPLLSSIKNVLFPSSCNIATTPHSSASASQRTTGGPYTTTGTAHKRHRSNIKQHIILGTLTWASPPSSTRSPRRRCVMRRRCRA